MVTAPAEFGKGVLQRYDSRRAGWGSAIQRHDDAAGALYRRRQTIVIGYVK